MKETSTKMLEILEILKTSDGYVSGEDISKQLNITRSAVCKYIKQLKNDGYKIDSVTRNGYILKECTKKLCAEELKNLLKNSRLGNPLYVFDSVTSTFDELLKLKKTEGTTVVAKQQTNGRGRLGRVWNSNEGGIYFSFMLMPNTTADYIQFITIVCALGVAKALNKYGNCKIKWPNDIVLNGKKVCGILTTATICMDSVECINVGIGINANYNDFGEALPYASSLKAILNKQIDENVLLSDVLKAIEKEYFYSDKQDIINDYRKMCVTLNSDVCVSFIKSNTKVNGKCISVLDDGSLEIETDENKKITVNSGEVSVRGLYGYV